jgi:hypothetical protein
MKKKVAKVKKLQLFRETLRDLESLDTQKVLGGGNQVPSCQSQCDVCDITFVECDITFVNC